MPVKKEEGLLTPKTVAKTLGVATGTVAAVATLVFAIADGPARADDRFPRILSEAELDQVHAGFMNNGPDLYDASGFYYKYIGNNTYFSTVAPENTYTYNKTDDTLTSVTPKTGWKTVLIGDTLNFRTYDERGVEMVNSSANTVPLLSSFPFYPGE